MTNHPGEIWAGVGAAMLNVVALLTSRQEHFEFALRCTSLVIGIIVGLLTAAVLILRILHRRRHKPDQRPYE